MNNKGLTYKDSGVNINAGYEAVKRMKAHVHSTFTEGVLSDIGGFSGMFALNKNEFEEPVLLSGTDGVGTKLMIAFMMDKHDTIGQDCVAMCVNDILCQGARPLFFLDYVASGILNPEKIEKIVSGISTGCIKAKCALIGGETAEMPGLYKEDEYDLAGFAVGIADKKKIITGEKIKKGDVLIGLPSSGLHSNGFSLVRKLFFDIKKYKIDQYIEDLGTTLGEELLKPTRIYYDPLTELNDKFDIKGISHITGGGFYENIPRMFPEGLTGFIDRNHVSIPPIFQLIQELGNIDIDEMYSTFNMGIGIVMAVDEKDADNIIKFLKCKNEEAYIIGSVIEGNGGLSICRR
ncbi:phosphoribosylformylglycinamidine cyclo-ligase [Acidilutibacter cellobiosedens]|jgi:phosphoribosylformylglycinamidine cyclo-ligase|uniref:Phosphoribosylformylglycinamidine cyclo-ligase n=1 Tax=Acidilutibacter cellobiosedens TaxID=2507161 RepID=A0A410Q933_9FIRM|nr:phosphoribosylformylglycinamidine cyclo-ligase [Acidilutibacter cellobiosedens]MBE6083729.1 phosphoribosylformylglycinamidine cyclo-ligase [Tissierellaceae bacterium]QAT60505.1 phosphoribosylformylglycinamidine cyclo-ligase [Acidilutibacter cellobiosedens]